MAVEVAMMTVDMEEEVVAVVAATVVVMTTVAGES
jgi:hypothetical protein